LKNKNTYRFIFGAGGTGGHLFPAVAVAQMIVKLKPEAEILFVGTTNKIEARVIPQLGFAFKSIWISGFSRKFNLNNLLFPIKLIVSLVQSLMINIKFKPKVAIGAGAYVSGPVLWGANVMGAKIMLLEQNSYPGITNRMLEKNAEEIHISFEDSKKYFRSNEKLFMSGNPVRTDLVLTDRNKSLAHYNLQTNKKTVLVLGGSQGALSINNTVAEMCGKLSENNYQIIWQCGTRYYDVFKKYESDSIKVVPFIEEMSAAYSAADIVIARAGATTIAEVSNLGCAVVFVPSKYVAANHQYWNAKSLEDNSACILITDNDLEEKLFSTVLSLMQDEAKQNLLKENIKKFSKPDAAKVIAERAIALAEIK